MVDCIFDHHQSSSLLSKISLSSSSSSSLLLSSFSSFSSSSECLEVVELGGGMAGLAALALVAVGNTAIDTTGQEDEMTKMGGGEERRETNGIQPPAFSSNNLVLRSPLVRAVITDGHPDAVLNNQIVARMAKKIVGTDRNNDKIINNNNADNSSNNYDNTNNSYNNNSTRTINKEKNTNVRVQRLLWRDDSEGARQCASLVASINNLPSNNAHSILTPTANPVSTTRINGTTIHNTSKFSSQQQQQQQQQQQHGQGFDLCLASDCTHFVQFHASLLATIGRLLKVGGYCIMCQPRRGDTLDGFIRLVNAVNKCGEDDGITVNNNDHDTNDNGGYDNDTNCYNTNCNDDKFVINDSNCNSNNNNNSNDTIVEELGKLFDVELIEKYNDDIYHRHLSLVGEGKGQCGVNDNRSNYDPDIHYPLILAMKKLREYDEVIDTQKAIQFCSAV